MIQRPIKKKKDGGNDSNKLTSLLKEKFCKNTLPRQFDVWLLVCYKKYNNSPKGDCEADLAFL